MRGLGMRDLGTRMLSPDPLSKPSNMTRRIVQEIAGDELLFVPESLLSNSVFFPVSGFILKTFYQDIGCKIASRYDDMRKETKNEIRSQIFFRHV